MAKITKEKGLFVVNHPSFNPKKKTKVCVALWNKKANDFDMDSRVYYEMDSKSIKVPMIYGANTYSIIILEHIQSTAYAPVYSEKITVTESEGGSADMPIYTKIDTRYVKWNNPAFIKAAKEITKQQTTDYNKIKACTNYVYNIVYDYIKAVKLANKARQDRINEGTCISAIPDTDLMAALNMKMGICWDTASLLCGLLRANGFATKLVIGDLLEKGFSIRHAWVAVYYEGKWQFIESVRNNRGKTKSAYAPSCYY